jgi:hypothetical protein
MPNWYCGTVTISGNITPFKQWCDKNKNTENGLENSFAQTFVPLSSGDWDFGTACSEWGTKWDLRNVQVLSDDDDENVFSFTFESAWSPPNYLWKQIEKRYGVEVSEIGYEEQQIEFHKYNRGRSLLVKRDNEWFAEKFNYMPSKEAENDEDLYYDEVSDLRYEKWYDVFHAWEDEIDENDPEWKDVADSYGGDPHTPLY